MREVADDEPGLARAQSVQVLEHGLAVVERAQSVDHDDGVERSREGSDEIAVLDVADEERKTGVSPARLFDHTGAEIHADAERGFERGQEITGAAAELEHAGARGNQKLEVAQILVVEERGLLQPIPALARAGVGEPADVLFARGHCAARPARVRMRDHPDRYTRFKFDLARNPMRPRCGMREWQRLPGPATLGTGLQWEADVPSAARASGGSTARRRAADEA